MNEEGMVYISNTTKPLKKKEILPFEITRVKLKDKYGHKKANATYHLHEASEIVELLEAEILIARSWEKGAMR